MTLELGKISNFSHHAVTVFLSYFSTEWAGNIRTPATWLHQYALWPSN